MVMMGVLTKTPPPPHSPLANPQFAPTYYIALFTATIIFLQRLKPLDIFAKSMSKSSIIDNTLTWYRGFTTKIVTIIHLIHT